VTSLLGPCHSIAPRVGGGFRVRGSRHHAAHANAFTVAETDGQWFHLPGTSPPAGAGRLLPLSAELASGYDAARGGSLGTSGWGFQHCSAPDRQQRFPRRLRHRHHHL